MMRCFTAIGHGAAACTINFMLDRSRADRSSSGTSRMRMKCAGTMKARVTRWRSTSRSHSRASQLGMITVVAPMKSAVLVQPPGPAWYAGPHSRCTSSGVQLQSITWPCWPIAMASAFIVVPCTTPFGRAVVPDV